MRWLARRLKHGIAGIGGNVAIGFLLGMVPVFGKFLGLPLEVRHLTLSTGSLTLAICTLGTDAFLQGAFYCVAGIAVLGALNFGVSFALALAVALRARAVEHGERRMLFAVWRRFFRSPLEFFFPPRNA
jgi:site-specific recombinase